MELNWNFLGEGGYKTKAFHGGGGEYGYVLELQNK